MGVCAIVLAAGKGTRMKSELPKVMHPLGGCPMLSYVLEAIKDSGISKTTVVTSKESSEPIEKLGSFSTVVQKEQLGTAHAVLSAAEHFKDGTDDVLVLCGDVPLLRPETLKALVEKRQATPKPSIVVLAMEVPPPHEYGRLVLNDAGEVTHIVETKEATSEQKKICLCNAGIILIDGSVALSLLQEIKNENTKGEYYLTDIIAIAQERGLKCDYVTVAEKEVHGINSRADLAQAERILQTQWRRDAMSAGATLRAPETVYFSFDTKLGKDVTIEPNVVFEPGVLVEDNVTIRAFSHIGGATIKKGAIVGPFARIRPKTVIGPNARVGNFGEIKNTQLEKGAKANHLSYVGDAFVGEGANIGAGTITCNYNGFYKSQTHIEAGVFIGSNASLIAPLTVSKGAIVGAGSVVTKNIPENDMAVARADQKNVAGGAEKYRQSQKSKSGKD